MSLVIYVSQKTVIISKYNLEFQFVPPAQNLTQAAMGAYRILRQSEVLQTQSSRDQKDEVITLLKHYGEALYNAIIPEHIRSQVYKAGGIFVYALEKSIIDIPWELLFDGSSFFALTQGVIRINKSSSELVRECFDYNFPSLRLSLNAYLPYQQQSLVPGFSAYVEELASKAVPRSPLIDLQVNGNADKASILQTLEEAPNIFLFSGYDSESGWLLQSSESSDGKSTSLSETELKRQVSQAVTRGLKIMILQTSYLLEQPKESLFHPVKLMFDCGVPFVISIQGRLARQRLREYLHIFLLNLVREETISRAHRQAINHIQSSLPLSWDWSWIRFHINQKLLESSTEQPLPPFRFNRAPDSQKGMLARQYRFKAYLPERRFCCCPELLQKLSKQLETGGIDKVVCLNSARLQPIESFIGEWLRRKVSSTPVSLSMLYYQRWGLSPDTKSRLPASKFFNLFSFLTTGEQLESHFDKSLIRFRSDSEHDFKLIIVYFPPPRPDHEFDRWLAEKQSQGWKILMICHQKPFTRLNTIQVNLDRTDQMQVINSFEDGLPEKWIELAESNPPACMKDVTLLNIAHKSEDPGLIDALLKKPTPDHFYRQTFDSILSNLPASRLKLFVSLYLLSCSFPSDLLIAALEIKKGEQDLKALFDAHLVDANLAFDTFWIPVHLQYQIQRLQLIPQQMLKHYGEELLQHLIAYQQIPTRYLSYLETGFQYCLLRLYELGDVEYAMHRNLQFGKKLARRFQHSFRYGQNILTSLELALHTKKGHLIQKAMFSLVEVLEELPFENQTIEICNWLLEIEKKHRNWPLVSQLQTQLASIYSKLDKKEKAIGLISSAIKLNTDIKNFSSRYHNLIAIALLLLDLGEFEKLSKLLTTAHFDMSVLNRDDVTKLWLIDGHMLFHNQKYSEAESSFKKVVNHRSLNLSDTLYAKTYLNLAEIYNSKGDAESYSKYLEAALIHLQAVGNMEHSLALHEQLYELSIAREDYQSAVEHLEWVFNYHREQGNKAQTQKAADLLGGLYFKIGEHSKSTELYSIAQGI